MENRQLTPAEQTLAKHRTAVVDLVRAKQRQALAGVALDRAKEEYAQALQAAANAEDAVDRLRGELEAHLAPPPVAVKVA